MKVIFGSSLRRRHYDIFVLRQTLRLRQILFWSRVFCMCSEECESQTKGFVLRTLVKKPNCVILVLLRYVNGALIASFNPMCPSIGDPDVELLLRKRTIVPLPDMPDIVTVGTKDTWIRFAPFGLESIECLVAVPGHPLPGQQRCAADATNGCGDVVIGKPHSIASQCIDVGSLNDCVPRARQRVESPIVGIENKHVEWRFGIRMRGIAQNQQQQ